MADSSTPTGTQHSRMQSNSSLSFKDEAYIKDADLFNDSFEGGKDQLIRLLRDRVRGLLREKEDLLKQIDAEEEFMTNKLQKKISQLQKEKNNLLTQVGTTKSPVDLPILT